MDSRRDTVKVKALRAVPYYRIRLPGEEFLVTPAYADFFTRHHLVERIGDAPILTLIDDESERGRAKRRYSRRDLQAED